LEERRLLGLAAGAVGWGWGWLLGLVAFWRPATAFYNFGKYKSASGATQGSSSTRHFLLVPELSHGRH